METEDQEEIAVQDPDPVEIEDQEADQDHLDPADHAEEAARHHLIQCAPMIATAGKV